MRKQKSMEPPLAKGRTLTNIGRVCGIERKFLESDKKLRERISDAIRGIPGGRA